MKSFRTTKLVFLVGLSSLSTMILFNNCSAYVASGDLSSIQDPLASQTPNPDSEQPTPTTPPPSAGPTQPQPAPIVPIKTTNNPAWMAGKSLNEWIEIPNTSGAGGANLDSFSGFAFREATSQIIIGAAGGHGDGTDNRVVSLSIETDQPKWVLHIAGSLYPKFDVSHYPDGTPSARHTYQHNFYVEPLKRLFLVGARYTAGNAYTFSDVDAFSFETNQWDPPKTWAPLASPGGYGALKIPGTDDIFTSHLDKWSASTALAAYVSGNPSSASVWSSPIKTRTDTAIRWPLAFDKKRNQIFTLQFGDGQGYSTQIVYSSRIDLATGTQTKIDYKPSETLELFKAEKPAYAAMDYDPENDRFLFYSGIGEAAGRVYVIKPSATENLWEMSLFQTTATSIKPVATPGAGINSSFKYVPKLKGFVLLPRRSSNVYFIKTAN